MFNQLRAIAASALLTLALVLPASAQGATFDMTSLNAAGSGSLGNTTSNTLSGSRNDQPGLKTAYTGKNKPKKLFYPMPIVGTKGLAPVFGLVGYGSLVGFNGPAVSPQDYVDWHNLTDTDAELAAQQTVRNWEQANDAQDMANATDGAQGYGAGSGTGYGPGNSVGSNLGDAIGNSLGNAFSNGAGF